MSTIYINLREDKSFHTIIIKKKIKEFTYLASIGYAGGGVYEEFFGKLKYHLPFLDYAPVYVLLLVLPLSELS